MNAVRFTATKLTNTGKKGDLKPDADGYYTHVIGGLNTFNSAGEYYALEGAKQLFEQSSIFMRRVKNGCLKAEVGHPKRDQNMSMDAFVNRILTIDEMNICCHFKEVWLDTEYGKNNPKLNNGKLVAIMAKIKPAGPKSASLEASLSNPNENTCFSIRALTKDHYERGVNIRVLTQIVTFDMVNEPGISIANKWDTPGLETLLDCSVTKRNLQSIIKSKEICVATEATRELALETLHVMEGSKSNNLLGKYPLFTKW